MSRMTRVEGRARRVLATLAVVGVVGAVAGLGAYSTFSSTTSNDGNTFASGTVAISDNDAGAAMYSVSNKKPGDTITQCIKVTYTGSVDSDVKLYTSSTIGSLGPYIDLQVRSGSGNPTFPGCTGFVADAADLYSGTLAAFPTSYATGTLDSGPGSNTKWVAGDAVVYRFTLTLQSSAPDSAQGTTTGAHSFVWEARNQ
jgi:Camelysin metallo-endopeptidase